MSRTSRSASAPGPGLRRRRRQPGTERAADGQRATAMTGPRWACHANSHPRPDGQYGESSNRIVAANEEIVGLLPR